MIACSEVPSLSQVIEKYGPEEEVNFSDPDLIELVARGYGFEGILDYLILQSHGEFSRYNTDYYLYRQAGRAVGSLAISDLSKDSTDETALAFWETIPDHVAKKLTGLKLGEVAGVVVLPEFQSQGIGTRLFNHMIEDLQPAIIMGGTRNPAAVIARSKAFNRQGYRSFYGQYEVITDPEIRAEPSTCHLEILQGYLADKLNDGELYLESTDTLPPTLPEIDHLPVGFKLCFSSLIRKQTEVKDEVTVIVPLISIKQEILE